MRFPSVTSDTTREVDFVIKSPNLSQVYSNPNTNLAAFRASMVQPANLSPCANATHSIFISKGFNYGISNGFLNVFGICEEAYSIKTEVKTSAAYANIAAGTTICTASGNIKTGKGAAYVINSGAIDVPAGVGAGLYQVIRGVINDNRDRFAYNMHTKWYGFMDILLFSTLRTQLQQTL